MRIQQQIEEKLHYFFQPTHLEVINESHQHNVPANSETHFKVILASKKFRESTIAPTASTSLSTLSRRDERRNTCPHLAYLFSREMGNSTYCCE